MFMKKKYKILLSAYACEPNVGSEPGVGWNWAIEIKKLGHEILIITRKNNKKVIEKELLTNKILNKKNFYYFDLPKFFKVLKKIIPAGVNLYYYLWQYYLYQKLKGENFVKNFDIIHHITFGVFRHPSFLWKFNKKFIFGPVGGYELMPKIIKKNLSIRNRLNENLREISNFFFLKFDSNLKNFLNSKSIIFFSRTKDTKYNLKKYYNKNIFICSEIGIDTKNKKKAIIKKEIKNFVFIGRSLYWKGGDILIDAFNLALKKNKNIRLSFYTEGREKNNWKRKVSDYNLGQYIKINGWVNHSKMNSIYKSNDVFIFPSLHDSGGNVLLEALSNSLPVLCLNIGGPGKIITSNCGIKVNINQKSTEQSIVKQLSNNIIKITENRKLYSKLSKGALLRAKTMSWKQAVKNVYDLI